MKTPFKSELFLGIDPGFHVTGHATLKKENNKILLLDYGYLQMSPRKHLSERVGEFYACFAEKIKQQNITHVVLETSFLGKNAQTFLKLGYLRGILYLLANQHNLSLIEFSPREIKISVTGFGGASKEQVATAMMNLFPPLKKLKAIAKNDVTDALAVALCGLWQTQRRF